MRATTRAAGRGAVRVVLLWIALGWPDTSLAEVVSLEDLERKAVESRVIVDGQAARSRGAEAEIRKAAAAYQPQVNLRVESTISPGRFLVKVLPARCQVAPAPGEDPPDCGPDDEFLVQGTRTVAEPDAFKPQVRNAAELGASGLIYDFGRTKAAVSAGKASRAAVDAERDATEVDVVRSVRAAYLGWLANVELARLSEAAARDAESQRARVAALIDQGVRPKFELGPARTDELLTKLELSRARGDLASARMSLEDVVRERLPEDAEPDLALLQVDREVPALDKIEDPAAVALERQRTAARALALASKRERNPQIGATLSVGVRQQSEDVFPIYAGGLTFTMPLWDGGLSAATAAAAASQAQEVDAQLHAHERDKEQAQRRAVQEVRQAREGLAIAEELVTLAEKRLADAQAGYELGVNGIEEIAAARAVLRRAQTEVLLSKVAHAQASLRFAPRSR